ncbi:MULTISPECIES: hypothetical protein [Bacillus]|nr:MULTISPECIES: hypothetical protein [Bacillus]
MDKRRKSRIFIENVDNLLDGKKELSGKSGDSRESTEELSGILLN